MRKPLQTNVRLALALWPFLAFFLSGASSLVFQMIWSRSLHHVFGSSSVAISSVVSVFMAGLALGAFLFGRIADRMARPLRAYAFAELGVAAFGLLVPVLLDAEGPLAAFNSALRARFDPAHGEASVAFMLARFAVILPVLLLPTTLMGGTLPLLARHFVLDSEDDAHASARVGALYATNTAGAVLGVFLAGFVLLPSIGVNATHNVALGCNVVLGIFALILGRAPRERSAPVARVERAEGEGPVVLPASVRGTRRLVGVAFALSGFCALLYEVVWSRALVSTIGASAYAFALILMTFLLGIAGGSAVASTMLERTTRAARGLFAAGVLACLPIALGCFARRSALAFPALVLLPLLVGFLARWLERRQRAVAEDAASPSRAAALCLLLPALASALAGALAYGDRLAMLALTLACTTAALGAGLFFFAGRVLLQLGFVQLFIALATFVSTLWADRIALTFAALVAPLYDKLADHVDHVLVLMFAMVALCVLPSALGMGAMFPLALRAVSGGGAAVGREVSVMYTRNTIGSIAGAWLPGFVLMPLLAMQKTLYLGIGVGALLALVLVVHALRRGEARAPAFAGAAASLALTAVLLLGVCAPSIERALAWDRTRMTLGVFRIALAKSALDEEAWGEPDIVYYRDGLATTVSVERWGRHRSLKNNGKVEASNGDDMATQINVAALPLMFHERAARDLDVAIIGFGSGVTVGAALQFPVRSVDVMELERAVVEASRWFSPVNHLEYGSTEFPYVTSERLRTLNEDGRNHLAGVRARYDAIISEPSNPWLTGVADLFTADHFRIAKRALRPGGVYGQWVQLYELSPDNVKIIYRTFAEHFRYVVAFSADDLSSDTILLGSDAPLRFDLPHLTRAMSDPKAAAELRRARVRSPYDVLGRVLFSGRDEVMAYAQLEERRGPSGAFVAQPEATGALPCPAGSCRRAPAPLNTDDNARIELAAPRDLIGFERYKGYLGTIYGERWPYGRLVGRLHGFGSGQAAAEHYARLSLALLEHGRKREAGAVLAEAERITAPAERAALVEARAVYATLTGAMPEPSFDEAWLQAFASDPTLSERTRARLGEGASEALDWLRRGEGQRAHRAALALSDSGVRHVGPPLLMLRALCAYRAGAFAEAVTDLETLLRAYPQKSGAYPEALYFLSRSHDALQHFFKGVSHARRWLEHAPGVPAQAAERTP